MAHSYRDARMATSLGRRFQGQNLVHCLDGLGVAAFVGVSDERTKVDLAMHLLSPFDQEPELIESLNAFFAADCCPSTAASALRIHRNTLSYRLEKISMLTGLDPCR
jgi:carbohydrate diacid regulator